MINVRFNDVYNVIHKVINPFFLYMYNDKKKKNDYSK